MFNVLGVGKESVGGSGKFYFGLERDRLCTKLEEFVALIRGGKVMVQKISIETEASVADFTISTLKIPFVEVLDP